MQLLFKVGFDMICDKGMTVAKKFGAKTSSGEPARKKLLKFGNNHSIYNISTYIFNIFIILDTLQKKINKTSILSLGFR